jgi:hypothetical protein
MLQLDKPLSNRWHAPLTMFAGQRPQLLFEWTDACIQLAICHRRTLRRGCHMVNTIIINRSQMPRFATMH